MQVALDSYSFHRYFGDWYPGLQEDPGSRRSIWDFLDFAGHLGVTGVSIESCFLEPELAGSAAAPFLARLRTRLDEGNFARVWAWGHLDGLGSGRSTTGEADLVRHLGFANAIGADTMRIVAGSRRTRPADWVEHKSALVPVLARVAAEAERAQVTLALENHIDLYADEILELITAVGSPWLRVCLDTANNLRLLEDPLRVAECLAPLAAATHVKDVAAWRGNPRDFAFWPSVPLGQGAVDLHGILRLLRAADYRGLLAIEIDYLHPRYPGLEENALEESVEYLRTLIEEVRRENASPSTAETGS